MFLLAFPEEKNYSHYIIEWREYYLLVGVMIEITEAM